ncbi:MAG: ATP-binding protein [Phycisphaerae bacterium]|jgi:predicted AAA+ superfamily ATPase
MADSFLFNSMSLPQELISDLRRMNPWWEGKAMQELPRTRRRLVGQIHRRLEQRLAPIIAVRGPRQIGKTTSQLQVLSDLLDGGVPPRNILRVQFDELPSFSGLNEPVLRIVEWFERTLLGMSLNDAAKRGRPTYLFFDELQNLSAWAEQLKSLVDSASTQVVVTGSSALRIELGRDSLAGRVNTLEAGVLSLTEIASFRGLELGKPFLDENGLEPLTRQEFWLELASYGRHVAAKRDIAFRWFSERGGYPLAHQRADVPWGYIADQLNETVIRRVIQHDLRLGERGRKRDAPLLEELFRLACRYIGQAPALQTLAREVKRGLGGNVGSQRVNHYLRFLGDTLLLRLIDPLEIRLKRRRGSAKICLADHALRASWLQEMVPLDPEGLGQEPQLQTLAGHVAESVTGALLTTVSPLDVAHLPARGDEPEIDFVLTIGTRRIPLEVKYQRRIDPFTDTEGLRTFLETAVNNAPFALLITQADTDAVTDPRIVTLPLSTLMLMR